MERELSLAEGLRGRRSVRRFVERPVEKDVLEGIVELAAFAPSWKNNQTTSYVAVTGEKKAQIAREATGEWNRRHIDSAPVLMVLTIRHGITGFEKDGTPSTGKGSDWEVFDAGIAAQTFCLAAYGAGLGTVIMGIFEEEKVARILELPEEERVGVLIALGYPAEEPEIKPRREVAELLSWK